MNAAAAAIALAILTTPAPTSSAGPTVQVGLKWLASQQKADGTWDSLNGFAPTTTTATAGLALLMEGSTPKDGAYAPHIRKTIAWLETNTSDKGMLASNGQNEMYQYIPSHSQALLFLVCAYDADDDPERRTRIAKVLTKATAFLVEQQTARGGWGFVGSRPGNDYDDSQSTATVLQALLAVRKAGIKVPRKATDGAVQYLSKATNNEGGIIYSIFGGQVPRGNDGQPMISSMAAAGALMQDGSRPELLAKWVKYANGTNTAQQLQLLRTNGIYAIPHQHHLSRVAFALGENGHRKLDPDASEESLLRWSVHRARLFKVLKETQGKDGNWPDQNFGPVYSTALTLVILQLDNDYLPAFSR